MFYLLLIFIDKWIIIEYSDCHLLQTNWFLLISQLRGSNNINLIRNYTHFTNSYISIRIKKSHKCKHKNIFA